MKNNRPLIITIVVLAVPVLWVGCGKPAAPEPVASEAPKEVSVDKWHTNVVTRWETNIVERWQTNTVVQNFTNEVVKEVPAKLSPAAIEAATVGYKFLKAPSAASSGDAFYAASPLAVEVAVNACDKSVVAEDANTLKGKVEAALRARSIALAPNSPHRLCLTVTPVLMNNLPSVASLAFRMDLKETVALQRKGDIIRCDAIVWSMSGSKLVRTTDMEAEMNTALEEQVAKFCDAYVKAKQVEADVKARIPSVPSDLLSGA